VNGWNWPTTTKSMKFQTAAFTWFTFFGGFRWNKHKGWKTKHVMGLLMPESIGIWNQKVKKMRPHW
jgi:hypothetical protein